MGIVTLITEVLVKIKPTDPLIFVKRTVRKKRNCSDSSGNSPDQILDSRYTYKKVRRTKSSSWDVTRSGNGDCQENNGISPILVQLTIMSYLYSDHIVQGTVRLRGSSGGHTVCEFSVCKLSGTSIVIMSHCDIHQQCVRRDPIVFSRWQEYVIPYLNVPSFSSCIRCNTDLWWQRWCLFLLTLKNQCGPIK